MQDDPTLPIAATESPTRVTITTAHVRADVKVGVTHQELQAIAADLLTLADRVMWESIDA